MFKSKKLISQIFLSYLSILIIALFISILYSSSVIKTLYTKQVSLSLKEKATLINRLLSEKGLNNLDSICKDLKQDVDIRITMILPSGRVVCDSDEDASKMDNHSDRPEIKAAFNGNVGTVRRYSFTEKYNMMYVAVPLYKNNKVALVVRTSKPILSITQYLFNQYSKVILFGFIVAIFGGIISYILARRINRPIKQINEIAQKFAKGDLEHHIVLSASEELTSLANTLNSMAEELNTKINTITFQNNQLEAIFSSMTESVIVLDDNGNVKSLNNSAEKLFNISKDSSIGKSFKEIFRNNDLTTFVREVYVDRSNIKEADIVLGDYKDERYLKVYGSRLCSKNLNCIGMLVVIYDLTNIKKLENIRKEFVANVSHELMTPITSIKGFLETLKDGALNDKENANKFIDISLQETDRLKAIIDDLLNLSRIEQNGSDKIDILNVSLYDIIESAVNMCKTRAIDKKIRLEFDCPKDITINASIVLFEQALVNLIDNAIKYNNEGGFVKVDVEISNKIKIKVIDNGHGISREHLPRIFERFYRVDKARSRKMGGTGLGLSIVKHIVQAHNGIVSVDSELSKGSVFTIELPFKS